MPIRSILRILFRCLLLVCFGLQLGNTGLPRVSIHHGTQAGMPHCNCGCACSQHPDAADSCLNPRNLHEISCGCQKAHTREFESPAPSYSAMLLPAAGPALAAPRSTRFEFPSSANHLSRALPAQPSPPS
ncbi:MAG: hypothetical protein KC488_03430 [Candidatus Cloacimonetes bacterium]|nr:hypothetical protein [Candidatus Cloacimonadota bacterium]